MAASSWGQSKLAPVEEPFLAVDCAVYDTGTHPTDKHSEACRSFVQLAKAKDSTLPLSIGPVYACFQISDELFVVDMAMDQAKSDNKGWAVLAQPKFAFYRSGIETGLALLNTPLAMDGKWNLTLSPNVVIYSAQTTKFAEDNLKTHLTISITQTEISFADWEIQASTGGFSYLPGTKSVQLPDQCAIFKKSFKVESSPTANIQHVSWKQIN